MGAVPIMVVIDHDPMPDSSLNDPVHIDMFKVRGKVPGAKAYNLTHRFWKVLLRASEPDKTTRAVVRDSRRGTAADKSAAEADPVIPTV